MNEAEMLDEFAGDDLASAQQAATDLFEQCRPLLRHSLRAAGVRDEDDLEDAIQDAFRKLWESRSRFQNQGLAAFRSLAVIAAKTCYLDLYRRRHGHVNPPGSEDDDDSDDIGDDDLSAVVAVASAFDAGELHRLADEVFLGVDRAVPPRTRDRQLLAAQLYYLDGEAWKDVVRTLPPAPGEPALTREVLDGWLADEGVLRSLAYREIYYSNDRLAGCLLGLAQPVDESVLDRLLREGAALPDWSAAETAVILWRYRHAMTIEHIASRKDCVFSEQELSALIDRLRARLPFNQEMTRLLAALDRAPQLEARTMLRKSGIWQRLALAYRFDDELQHTDIHERTQPAAQAVGHAVTMGMLNVWLSNGRLVKRLADAYREVMKDCEND